MAGRPFADLIGPEAVGGGLKIHNCHGNCTPDRRSRHDGQQQHVSPDSLSVSNGDYGKRDC